MADTWWSLGSISSVAKVNLVQSLHSSLSVYVLDEFLEASFNFWSLIQQVRRAGEWSFHTILKEVVEAGVAGVVAVVMI